jgi:hypothetical protein
MGAVRRARSGWAAASPRERVARIGPWASLVLGVVLGFAASVPSVHFLESVRFVGSVGPNTTANASFNRTGFSYASFEFESPPGCPLRVHVLEAAEAAAYLNGSGLPDGAESLNCQRTSATFGFDIVLLVFVNAFNGTETYALRADLFLIDQPRALWILPAYALFLLGAIAVAIRMLTGGVVSLAEAVARREEIDPREFRRGPPPGP